MALIRRYQATAHEPIKPAAPAVQAPRGWDAEGSPRLQKTTPVRRDEDLDLPRRAALTSAALEGWPAVGPEAKRSPRYRPNEAELIAYPRAAATSAARDGFAAYGPEAKRPRQYKPLDVEQVHFRGAALTSAALEGFAATGPEYKRPRAHRPQEVELLRLFVPPAPLSFPEGWEAIGATYRNRPYKPLNDDPVRPVVFTRVVPLPDADAPRTIGRRGPRVSHEDLPTPVVRPQIGWIQDERFVSRLAPRYLPATELQVVRVAVTAPTVWGWEATRPALAWRRAWARIEPVGNEFGDTGGVVPQSPTVHEVDGSWQPETNTGSWQQPASTGTWAPPDAGGSWQVPLN